MKFIQKQENYFEVHMLTNNRISGLLPVESGSVDGVFYLDYRTEEYCTLAEETAELPLRIRQAVRYGAGLEERLREYMISGSHIVLLPEAVCFERQSGKFFFAVDPAKESTFQESLRHLLQDVIRRMPHRNSKDIDAVYRLLQLADEPGVNFRKLAEALQEESADEKENMTFEEDPLFREMGLTLSVYPEEDEDEKTVLMQPDMQEERIEEPEEADIPEETKLRKVLLAAGGFFRKYTFETCIAAVTIAAVLLLILL